MQAARQHIAPDSGKKTSNGVFFQPKLAVNQPGDAHEQEADRVADAVVQRSSNYFFKPSAANHLQRQCAACEHEEKEQEELQRKPLSNDITPVQCAADDDEYTAGPGVEAAINSSKGSGSALPAPVREQMESSIGADFSGVKIHTGDTAVQMNRNLNARAFTTGSDIYFNSGEYNPSSKDGQHLLAHELTHVVQQSSGMKRIARATYKTGNATVEINYSFIDTTYGGKYDQGAMDKYAAYTGNAGSVIQPKLTGWSLTSLRKLTFAIDLLTDNPVSGLDKDLAVDRLIASVPTMTHTPLTNFPARDFENEVLRASGWFEYAQTAGLNDPNRAEQRYLNSKYNPAGGGGGSACPSPRPAGTTLDEVRLRKDLDAHMRKFLSGEATAIRSLASTAHNFSDVQSLADMVQGEALSFFAPYIGMSSSRQFLAGWKYSAHLHDSRSPGAINQDLRLSYVDNRSRKEAGNTGLFTAVNFDSRCDADELVLQDIINNLEADATVQTDLNTILSWKSYTHHSNTSAEVTVNLQYNNSTNDCEARWRIIETLCHELLHAYISQDFLDMHKGRQLIKEGFTEILGDQLYEYIRGKADNDARYRSNYETGLASGTCTGVSIPASTQGYTSAAQAAEDIRFIVKDDRFRAAYFLGRNTLAGLQPKLQTGGSNDKYEKEADAVADKVVQQPAKDTFFKPAPVQRKPVTENISAAKQGMIQTMRPLNQSSPANTRAPGEQSFRNVYGNEYYAETDAGSRVRVWVAYNGYPEADKYWCHGNSLRTYHHWGYSVYSGDPLRHVLLDEYVRINPNTARWGDIVVWEPSWGHSCMIIDPVLNSDGQLDYDRTMVSTKNGRMPLTSMTLSNVIALYMSDLGLSPDVKFYRHR
jgi:Domain of unknown function (DUF4157)